MVLAPPTCPYHPTYYIPTKRKKKQQQIKQVKNYLHLVNPKCQAHPKTDEDKTKMTDQPLLTIQAIFINRLILTISNIVCLGG